jgi:hypothetical protein
MGHYGQSWSLDSVDKPLWPRRRHHRQQSKHIFKMLRWRNSRTGMFGLYPRPQNAKRGDAVCPQKWAKAPRLQTSGYCGVVRPCVSVYNFMLAGKEMSVAWPTIAKCWFSTSVGKRSCLFYWCEFVASTTQVTWWKMVVSWFDHMIYPCKK